MNKKIEDFPNNNENVTKRKITRIGVYGACFENEKMLLIKQNDGPHKGKFDFPGGGIEFGETPEQALRREFAEEIAMNFADCTPVQNLTAIVDVPKQGINESYLFYQIGMIYKVKGLSVLKENRWQSSYTCG